MSEKELLDRVLSCFTIPVNLLKDGEEKHIQSEFLIPQQLVDFPIFKDMLFNNLIFDTRFIMTSLKGWGEKSTITEFWNKLQNKIN